MSAPLELRKCGNDMPPPSVRIFLDSSPVSSFPDVFLNIFFCDSQKEWSALGRFARLLLKNRRRIL
jgi:hypothetical protein